MIEPGHCRPTVTERLRIAPGVLVREGPHVLSSIREWTGAWAKHDPRELHWHLGPVAVDRAARGQGIGGALLMAFVRRMDERRMTAYLETDKPENVTFYEKFGFAVTSDEPVLGVTSWYMTRQPQLASARRNGNAGAPAVRRVLETALYCDALERTARFYREVLGFKTHFEDARLVALDAGGGTVLLLFRRGGSTSATPIPGGTIPPHDGAGPSHVALAVAASDFEAWEAKLDAAGVAIEGRVSWERGGRSLYFRDPDGHSVELATPGTWATY
jgi:catechol 2,3-dioxygenase-like lactoylglutathione lyase family enzyme